MNNNNDLEMLIEKVKLNVISNLNKIKELDINLNSGPDPSLENLYKSVKSVSSSSNQVSIISDLLSGIKQFCTRTAIFLIKDDKLRGWGGAGFNQGNSDIDDKNIKKVFFSITADTVFKEVIKTKKSFSGNHDSHKDNHMIFNRFGGSVPGSIFVRPFFVKGKPQAVLYADSFKESEINEKMIEILSIVGEMSLDLLPFKQKIMARVKTQEYDEKQEEEPVLLLTDDSVAPPQKKTQKKLSNAERLAKVIVTDIILYNKKQVDEAREAKKLFSVLGDTIMQSKEIYMNKFDDLVPFETQLLETLADGDRDALKGYNFESI